MSEKLDKRVIVAAARGDEGAFGRLVESYQQPIYNLAFRMLRSAAQAQDIAQGIFLHLLDSLERYDPARAFEPWLFRVATNYILNHLKRRKIATVSMESLRTRGQHDEAPVELTDPNSSTAAHAENSEKYESLRAAVAELPPDWRAVITLHYMQSFPVSEIAAILEIPPGTVKNRLFRARNMLHEKLRKLLET